MLEPELDFAYSVRPEPHGERTKSILRSHPPRSVVIGPNPVTFWWTLGIVALQIAVAWLVAPQPWWVVFVVAYRVGAFANHALFVMIHECAHRLVFKRRLPNILTGLLADLPLFFPGAMSFQKYHLKHHAFQGVYELDGDLPFRWEARLVGQLGPRQGALAAAVPDLPGAPPVAGEEFRLGPLDDGEPDRPGGVNAAAWVFFGPKAVAYFALSLFFSIGLHPLGARWIQRHYLTEEGEQETFSYYGPLNRLAFNVGYHNEHHDFPSVPWNRLPRSAPPLPRCTPPCPHTRSWARLLLRFLFDRNITSLFADDTGACLRPILASAGRWRCNVGGRRASSLAAGCS